jgi:hypothetical protein
VEGKHWLPIQTGPRLGADAPDPAGLLRARRAAKRLPHRPARLRISVVRGGLPCDPPVGGHSCNGTTLPSGGQSMRPTGSDRQTGLTPKADMPYSRANSSRTPPSRPRASARSLGARVCGLCAGKRGGIRPRGGVSSLVRQARDPAPNFSVKNVRVAVLRASD